MPYAPRRHMTTVSFKTIGCKFNQSETDDWQREFAAHGYHINKFGEASDVTIINTCTVTHAADRDCRNLIRKARQVSPKAIIVVTGCYAKSAKAEISKLPEVDLVLDQKEKNGIVQKIAHLASSRHARHCESKPREDEAISAIPHTRALLKVQEGCNYFCSYCIVPFVRGTPHGFSFAKILTEAKSLVDQGHLEIVITGINVGTYSSTENNKTHTLEDLLDELQNIAGLKRLRLSSLEPNTITDRLLSLMASSSVICPHLHVPLQAGDDAILKAMNRKYTTQEYQQLMNRIHNILPGVALGTDIIAGFPMETEEQFQNTLNFVAQQPFTYLHVFSYSDRKGTKASELDNKVASQTIKQRARALITLGQQKKTAYLQQQIGQNKHVYFDQVKKDFKLGYTDNYIRIAVRSDQIKRGDYIKVFLKELTEDKQGMRGELSQSSPCPHDRPSGPQ